MSHDVARATEIMGRRRVAVATCRSVPHLDSDGALLLESLDSAGLSGEAVVWDDPAVDWQVFDAVLVRSTWDYVRRRDDYLDWARTCPCLMNSFEVLEWNTDKHYLRQLDAAGVPIVPTQFIEVGDELALPPAWAHNDIVVKPTVGASAADTGRFFSGSPLAQRLVATLHADDRAAMVQPYQAAIDDAGETALVFLGGEFSHAMRKDALLVQRGTRAPVVGDAARDFLSPTTATAEQLEVALAALALAPGVASNLAYARVDLVPDANGRPTVLELELVEPSLFLQWAPQASPKRFARYIAQRIESALGN